MAKKREYLKIRDIGRPRKFEKPEDLAKVANEYFEWAVRNPIKEQVIFHYQGSTVKDTINKLRAFSIEGLCNYIGIGRNTFYDYCEREDFSNITTRIKGLIEVQQFEGASAGQLNPNIIARKLGLMDNTQQTVVHKEQPLFPED